MATVYVKPIEGATVYYPGTRTALPATGDHVDLDTYWQRRINDGSVTIVPIAAAVVEPQTESRAEHESAKQTSRRGRE